MNSHFNPLEYSRELVKAGVPEPQADAHANALAKVLEQCVAQPTQLHAMKKDLGSEFRSEINLINLGFKTEINRFSLEFKTEIDHVEKTLHGEIQALKADLTRRIDLLEERMKRQRLANGIIIALLIGLYVQMGGLYLQLLFR